MKRPSTLLVASLLVLSAPLASPQIRPALPGGTESVRLTTPRIPPLAESQWTDQHRGLVGEYAPDGRVGNGLATLLHVPEISYRPLRGRFDERPLEGACGKLSSSYSCFFSSGSFRRTYSRMPSSATPTVLTPY